VRKGSVGGWREWLDDEDVALVERTSGGVLRRLGYDLRDAGRV
jgi:hypothetical protein